MVTGSFPGVNSPGRGDNHPPLSNAEVKDTVELHLYSSLCHHGKLKDELYLNLLVRVSTTPQLLEIFWNGFIRPYRAESSNKFVEHWKIDDHSDRFVALICRTRFSYFLATPFAWSLLAAGLMNTLTHGTVLKLIPFTLHRIFANAPEKQSSLKINFLHP